MIVMDVVCDLCFFLFYDCHVNIGHIYCIEFDTYVGLYFGGIQDRLIIKKTPLSSLVSCRGHQRTYEQPQRS
jgi:hypothetical protein